jgi:hypothetical protein
MLVVIEFLTYDWTNGSRSFIFYSQANLKKWPGDCQMY